MTTATVVMTTATVVMTTGAYSLLNSGNQLCRNIKDVNKSGYHQLNKKVTILCMYVQGFYYAYVGY